MAPLYRSVLPYTLALSITGGIISVIGSTIIIVVLLRSPKRLKSIYRRLVFGMSCMDILHSLSYVAAGLPTPKDTPGDWTRNAIGNIATCNIQGLMNYMGVMGSLLYDCMLSIYFVMVVVYSKREDAIQKRIEPFFHAISIVIPLGAGIFLLVTDNYNDAGTICWIAPFPIGCGTNDNDVECTRGEHAYKYRWLFEGIPILSILLIVIACMVRLVWFIRKRLKKMNKYGANEFTAKVEKKESERRRSAPSQSGTNLHSDQIRRSALKKSKNETQQTSTQAMLYVAALLLTFVFGLIYQIAKSNTWLFLLQVAFIPLLGFFNFFIFIRPRVVMTMQSKPELSLFQAFYTAITAKEVKPPVGRRGSVGMNMRRSCAVTLGRRSTLTSTDGILAAAARMIQEEDSRELEDGLNGVVGMEHDSPPNSTCELEQLASDPVPNSPGAQETGDPSNAIHDADEAFNMTEDYKNML